MKARRERLGGLDCVMVDGGEGDGGPVVVLLHGFGAPGEDLVPLARVLGGPPGTRWLFPAAPLSLDMFGGRAWWMIDFEEIERAMAGGLARDLSARVPEGMPAARERVVALLDEVDQLWRGAPLVLGGFSQGAMLACDVALRQPRPLAGLVVLSGTLVAEQEWRPLLAARAGLRVFQSHGRQDPLLPFAAAERLRDALTAAGATVEWAPFSGGHEIPDQVIAGLRGFLRGVVALT